MARWKTFCFGSDSHGDMVDPKASKAFLKFVKDWQPDVRIAGGDHFDMRPLRRKADEHEKRESLRSDIEAGTLFLKQYEPHHLLLGNHEMRLYYILDKAQGVMLDWAQDAVAEFEKLTRSLKCKVKAYDKYEGVLQIGNLKFVHGFHQGVFAARQAALAYGNVVMGHCHQISQHTIPAWPTPQTGYIAGCLCQLRMPYNSTQVGTLSHRHGWIFGAINERTGNFKVWTAEEVDGVWLVPQDL